MIHTRGRNLRFEAILLQHGNGIGKRGWIGGGRAGCNDVKRIADYIGDDQAEKGAPFEGLAQAAALALGKMLTDTVHFVDGRSASVQKPGNLLLVIALSPLSRRQQKSRSAAREQTDG